MIPSANMEDAVDKILRQIFPNGGTNFKVLDQFVRSITHDNDLEENLPKAVTTPLFACSFLARLLKHFYPIEFIPSGPSMFQNVSFSWPSVRQVLAMSEGEQRVTCSKLLKLIKKAVAAEKKAEEDLKKQEIESQKMRALLIEDESRKEKMKQGKKQGKKCKNKAVGNDKPSPTMIQSPNCPILGEEVKKKLSLENASLCKHLCKDLLHGCSCNCTACANCAQKQ